MQSILVLTSTYPRWEKDTEPAFVHDLCRQLATQYRVVVLAPHHPGTRTVEQLDGIEVRRFRYCFPFAERLAYNGGIITNLKNNRIKLLLVPLFFISLFLNAWWLCRTREISLIHAHWVIPQGLAAVMLGRLSGRRIPVLCTSHGGDLFSLQSGILESLKKYVFEHADHITVVSSAMLQRLETMGCNTGHVTVQSMGVDLASRFVPDHSVSKTTDLVFVGRLVEKKGVATLIEAVHLLRSEFPQLSLTIVGDGPDLAMLTRQVERLNLADRVRFLGAVPNDSIPVYYQLARIAVVPSVVARDGDQEGLGLVAVEALGCGCVTLVSDLPALRDVIEDGHNGRVFKSGDAADLASKIKELLSDSGQYRALSEHARSSVIGRFDWTGVGTRYRSVISDCLPLATHSN